MFSCTHRAIYSISSNERPDSRSIPKSLPAYGELDLSCVGFTQLCPNSWDLPCASTAIFVPIARMRKRKGEGRSPGTAPVPSHYCCAGREGGRRGRLLGPRQLSIAWPARAGSYPNPLTLKTSPRPGPLNTADVPFPKTQEVFEYFLLFKESG